MKIAPAKERVTFYGTQNVAEVVNTQSDTKIALVLLETTAIA